VSTMVTEKQIQMW